MIIFTSQVYLKNELNCISEMPSLWDIQYVLNKLQLLLLLYYYGDNIAIIITDMMVVFVIHLSMHFSYWKRLRNLNGNLLHYWPGKSDL